MTFWTSVLWKILMQVVKKWPKIIIKWPFMTNKFSIFFLTKLQKTASKRNVIYIIALDLIKIWIIWALQNDCQNLGFVKNINVLGKKMIRNTYKNGQHLGCHFHFETLFRITVAQVYIMLPYHCFWFSNASSLTISLLL